MSLADFQAVKRVHELKGGTVEVGGLTLESFAKLIQLHISDVEAIFTLVESTIGGTADFTEGKLDNLIFSALKESPNLAASIIAYAAGEYNEDAIRAAASIPVAAQITILRDIVDLTFEDVGGIKKAMETIASLLQAKAAQQQVSPISDR